MEKTRWEAGLFFVMPSITIVFLISFGLLDRCSFRTLFELEGTSKPQLSFSTIIEGRHDSTKCTSTMVLAAPSFLLAQKKELKKTSTLTKPSPIWEGCN